MLDSEAAGPGARARGTLGQSLPHRTLGFDVGHGVRAVDLQDLLSGSRSTMVMSSARKHSLLWPLSVHPLTLRDGPPQAQATTLAWQQVIQKL